MLKNYLFTSESVSEGHPDKVADQISDAILDQFLMQDPEAKVACETFCSTGMVVVMGEVKAEAYVDIQNTVRNTIRKIGYTKAEYMFDASSCGVLSALHEQSPDINRGVERKHGEDQGAGDQGMMFGYACRDTEDYMPLPLYLSHKILEILSDIRHNEPALMPYLRPDAKSQFTIEYDGETHAPVKVHTIVLSTQHDEFVPKTLGKMSYDDAVAQYGHTKVDAAMQAKIREDVEKILIPRLKKALSKDTAALIHDYILHVNPTGKRESHREVRDWRPPRGHRPYRQEDHRGHLRRQGRPRRRSLLRKRPFKGRPQRSLCRPLHCQEPCGRRSGIGMPCAACIRNWRGKAC